MDSLVGYGSDDEVEERYGGTNQTSGGGGHGGCWRRREDDTNYDDVNMDMSEDSQGSESEPELPQAEPTPPRQTHRDDRKQSSESRERERERDSSRRRRETPPRQRPERDVDRRDKRDSRHRGERSERGVGGNASRDASRRGLLGDRPDDKLADKMPALMDLKPFGGEPPLSLERKSHDARDAVSPRFAERDRDRDRRDRDRDRDRDYRGSSRHSEEKRASHRYGSRDRERSRSRGAAPVPAAHPHPPPAHPHGPAHAHAPSTSIDRRSPNSDYRPSYKVNKKLEVMEKMGLQIKTPDGSMATAQQLRAAAADTVPNHQRSTFFNHGAMSSHRILDQVQKRKLLWSNKAKNETEEAAKWSGTRFAQDSDGKQVSKFMRLMGIKEPAAVKPEAAEADPIKKQEELFQAMQAQYEVARATTHTMRGVGLGFQRGQY